MEYIFPKITLFVYVGWGIVLLGVLFFLGLIKGVSGSLARLLGFILLVALGIFIVYISAAGKLTIKDRTVIFHVRLYSKKVIHADDIKRAQFVNFDEDISRRPIKKLSGTFIGDFRSGWFELKNGDKAFLLIKGKRGIIVTNNRDEKFIFGIEDFEKLKKVFETEITPLEADS